ncbi:MAG TPA: metal-dependent hydrolase [Bacteroidetes bacterium]|nr:metal-dependent hydrolase [Bacteroidota bacterium]
MLMKSLTRFNHFVIRRIESRITKFRVNLRSQGYVLLTVSLLFMMSCAQNEPPKSQLTVMSYNIAAGFGDIDGIANVIAEANPDVVGLQEVDVHWGERSGFINQAEYLGAALNMHTFFAEIYTLDPDSIHLPAKRYGLAFLSKYEFVTTKNHTLSRLSTQTEPPELIQLPGFAEIAIEKDGKIVRLFNTHLDYRSDPSVRKTQIQEMFEIMGDLDDAIVLMGDLNAQPHAPELGPVFAAFEDSWKDKNDPGYTFPGDDPVRRIDYIMHTKSMKSSDSKVIQSAKSDHAPVMTILEF